MSCKVKVADWVRDFLNALPREVRLQVYQKLLVDLPANPDTLLGERVYPFAHKYVFQATALDSSQSPAVRWWLVFVVSRENAGELHIESVRDANDPPRN